MSAEHTAEIRRRHGIKLLHLVEQVDAPLRALLNHVAIMCMPEHDEHFSNNESYMVRGTIGAIVDEMAYLGGLAQALIDRPLVDIQPWEPGDPTPDADWTDTEDGLEWELPF